MSRGWIGVDLDGTLAEYTSWKGPEHIGEPVPRMLARVRQWLAEGKTVKLFTARAAVPELLGPVRAWLQRYELPLEITNVKDPGMLELWDDRSVQVIPNTGLSIKEHLQQQAEQKIALNDSLLLWDIDDRIF